jgi:hypothetical protein
MNNFIIIIFIVHHHPHCHCPVGTVAAAAGGTAVAAAVVKGTTGEPGGGLVTALEAVGSICTGDSTAQSRISVHTSK